MTSYSTAESGKRYAVLAAYAALGIALVGLVAVMGSGASCRFAGTASQDHSGVVDQPGRTAGMLGFTIAPLVSVVVLALFVKWRRQGSPLPTLGTLAAAVVVPLGALVFFLWVAKAAFACGLPLGVLL